VDCTFISAQFFLIHLGGGAKVIQCPLYKIFLLPKPLDTASKCKKITGVATRNLEHSCYCLIPAEVLIKALRLGFV
jgi:hypothetical protein